MARERRLAPDDRFIGAGGGAALLDSLGIGLRVLEAEDVLRRDLLVLFLERARLDEHRDPLGGAQPEVVPAAIADSERCRQTGGLERGVAFRAREAVGRLAPAVTRQPTGAA